ncbi:MAG: TetR/AcrR family transcriptional regulator [Gammaproteobacteria bacterium]|jgi:AcrR family transcriptional regulator|nr:TetR/AcrR family transcriptional regulator [Gammaproteobacteria bacterium]MBT3723491.1 TetR/AcrR family transcriptional regulator [Gammaproteobacteria bacterium]MBT4076567.1 TetR/AcrR family transcriptional regulator [Gammaproteobacteria bacterium]MBT4194301.1 TetR/AcrR family transcriptional regulator [Gammaproteobacteria bacterium]MBT4450855.1 TetR/AcrR family transcriptional regulator [Gammaproteobacteria bacterium]
MQKSRINTEQRILDAVKSLLLNKGFPDVGINAISREAGCDKVLIYRYFGGLNGLLERFAEESDLWWTVDEIVQENMDEISQFSLPQFLDLLLKRHIKAVQQRPLTQEIMAWEMSDSNPLTLALNKTRTEQGMLLFKKVRLHFNQPNIDVGGILGIFGAAINYLVIRTRHSHSEYEKEEWWRLEQTISSLLTCQTGKQ